MNFRPEPARTQPTHARVDILPVAMPISALPSQLRDRFEIHE